MHFQKFLRDTTVVLQPDKCKILGEQTNFRKGKTRTAAGKSDNLDRHAQGLRQFQIRTKNNLMISKILKTSYLDLEHKHLLLSNIGNKARIFFVSLFFIRGAGFLFINTFLAKSHDGLFKDDVSNSSGLGAILAPPGWQWFYPTGDANLPQKLFQKQTENRLEWQVFPKLVNVDFVKHKLGGQYLQR